MPFLFGSSRITRLLRNCSDWYPLLDICGYKHCLIAYSYGVYDPATPNGRLLLGLKGQLSELELHTIRLTAGLHNKAQRGDLALSLPFGLVRLPPSQDVRQLPRINILENGLGGVVPYTQGAALGYDVAPLRGLAEKIAPF